MTDITKEELLKSYSGRELAEALLRLIMTDVLYGKLIGCRTHEDAVNVVENWLKESARKTM